MLYERASATPWVIELLGEDDKERYEGFYITTWRDGEKCEEFTLTLRDVDAPLVQIRLHKNGDIVSGCFVPANVVVYKQQQKVTIALMCDVSVKDGVLEVIMKPEWTN